MTSKIKIIYLLAAPFSGTTLLSRLAALHPQIASVGEMVNVIKETGGAGYLCSCNMKVSDCQFWLGVKDRMNALGISFDLADFDITPPKRVSGIIVRGNKMLETLLRDPVGRLFGKKFYRGIISALPLSRRVEALSRSILAQSGKTVLFDASKNPDLYPYLVGSNQFEVIVIHMVRDPRGVGLSMMKNLGRKKYIDCVSDWVAINDKIEQIINVFGRSKAIVLRYEDLCRAPTSFMSRLYKEVNLVDVESTFRPLEDCHIIGNRMRLAPVDQILLDERWRNELGTNELSAAKMIAGAFAQRYGYF